MGWMRHANVRHQRRSHCLHDLLLSERDVHYDVQSVRAVLLALAALALPCQAGDWTREDSQRQAVLTGLVIVDWAQTRKFIKNPCANQDCTKVYYETNPLLGRNPSVGKANNLIGASIVAHAGIAYLLPPAWRHAWQYVWIGGELGAIGNNYGGGIRFGF